MKTHFLVESYFAFRHYFGFVEKKLQKQFKNFVRKNVNH